MCEVNFPTRFREPLWVTSSLGMSQSVKIHLTHSAKTLKPKINYNVTLPTWKFDWLVLSDRVSFSQFIIVPDEMTWTCTDLQGRDHRLFERSSQTVTRGEWGKHTGKLRPICNWGRLERKMFPAALSFFLSFCLSFFLSFVSAFICIGYSIVLRTSKCKSADKLEHSDLDPVISLRYFTSVNFVVAACAVWYTR